MGTFADPTIYPSTSSISSIQTRVFAKRKTSYLMQSADCRENLRNIACRDAAFSANTCLSFHYKIRDKVGRGKEISGPYGTICASKDFSVGNLVRRPVTESTFGKVEDIKMQASIHLADTLNQNQGTCSTPHTSSRHASLLLLLRAEGRVPALAYISQDGSTRALKSSKPRARTST